MRFKQFILNEWLTVPEDNYKKFINKINSLVAHKDKLITQNAIDPIRDQLIGFLRNLLLYDENTFEHGETVFKNEIDKTVELYKKIYSFNKNNNSVSKVFSLEEVINKLTDKMDETKKKYYKSLFLR